jgi:hypothetical protein
LLISSSILRNPKSFSGSSGSLVSDIFIYSLCHIKPRLILFAGPSFVLITPQYFHTTLFFKLLGGHKVLESDWLPFTV